MITTAEVLEQLVQTELEAILEFLEEKGVPLTPEQKADLGIDNDDE